MLACIVLHNYIAVTDPHDKFLNEKVIVQEEHGEIVDENDGTNINFSNTMATR